MDADAAYCDKVEARVVLVRYAKVTKGVHHGLGLVVRAHGSQ